MREMKDSGVEWIGEIPKDWDTKRIKAVLCERNETNSPVKTNFILSLTNDRGIIPYTEKGDVGNKSKDDLTGYKLAYEGDIVLNSMNVIIGSVALSSYYGCVSPVYYMLYTRNQQDSIKYYNYLFQTKELQNRLKGYGNGIMEIRMRIQMSKLNTVEFPIAPSDIQQRIADYLDRKCYKIDEIIEKESQVIEKLKAYKQSVITEAVTKGVNPDVPMKDSGVEWIGEVPEHWVVSRIARVANANKYSMVDGPFGSDMKNEEYVDEGIPIVQLTNIKSFNHFTNTLKYITEEKHIQLSRHTAYKGDIVIAKMMPAGRACILSDEFDEYVLAADAIRLAVSDDINKNFVLYSLNTYCIEECTISSKGTTRVRISLDIARRLKIILPPFSEQQTIADYLDKKCTQIDETIAKKQATIEKLTAYKKSLIYEVVTGKKEV